MLLEDTPQLDIIILSITSHVLYFVLSGLGFGLVYLPAVVCVGYYFESKRALATGIAVCGSGIGTMIFPPLLNYLISVFTWRGTHLLIAGFILNCCVSCTYLFPDMVVVGLKLFLE